MSNYFSIGEKGCSFECMCAVCYMCYVGWLSEIDIRGQWIVDTNKIAIINTPLASHWQTHRQRLLKIRIRWVVYSFLSDICVEIVIVVIRGSGHEQIEHVRCLLLFSSKTIFFGRIDLTKRALITDRITIYNRRMRGQSIHADKNTKFIRVREEERREKQMLNTCVNRCVTNCFYFPSNFVCLLRTFEVRWHGWNI